MIEPGEIADHGFVVTVIALADLHGSNLCQTHLQVPPKCVLVEWLTAGLHMALDNRNEVTLDHQHSSRLQKEIYKYCVRCGTHFKLG